MTALNPKSYRVFLQQVLHWARQCVELIRFRKSWETGQVPSEEMAERALSGDKALVEEIFYAETPAHSPSLDVQMESRKRLAAELFGRKPSKARNGKGASDVEIIVYGSGGNRKTKKEEGPATPQVEPADERNARAERTEAETVLPFPEVPLVPTQAETDVVPTSEEAFPGRPTILVIDDYKPLCQMLVKALKGARYNVCSAEDGIQGIVRIHENTVDLIVTDIQMPKLDGFEMSKMLNVRDKTRDIPIIFLTEVLDERTKAIAKRLGAADTLIKPFTMDALFDSVRTILASHPASRSVDTEEEEITEPALAQAEG